MPFLLCPDAGRLYAWLMHLGMEFRNRAFTFPGQLSPPAAFPNDFAMPWSMVLSQRVLDAKFANATTQQRFGRLPGLSQTLVLSVLPIEMLAPLHGCTCLNPEPQCDWWLRLVRATTYATHTAFMLT
jgi:hypothetical protein